jgi:hypothetical protein
MGLRNRSEATYSFNRVPNGPRVGRRHTSRAPDPLARAPGKRLNERFTNAEAISEWFVNRNRTKSGHIEKSHLTIRARES